MTDKPPAGTGIRDFAMAETTTPTIEPQSTEPKTKPSYIWGVGRRKTSVARVRLSNGSGKITHDFTEITHHINELLL